MSCRICDAGQTEYKIQKRRDEITGLTVYSVIAVTTFRQFFHIKDAKDFISKKKAEL